MQAAVTVTPAQIPELLLGLATVRPVFLWGAPGIGKSSLVRKFADSLGLECVSLLGTQLAPEDLIGVPQIRDGRSVFCPPEAIARDEPYCLFLDELNAAAPDVQKAFYSLILDRRIGSYELPAGSIVIGAGNRATDNALARPIASALVNRLTHVHLQVSAGDWLVWAGEHGIHPWDRALNWFVSSYPLLGGLASGLKIVADAELARAQGIYIAAVSATAGEIYVNPLRSFEDEEWRFILAHEMLHAALRHGERRGARGPYLHNVAADYVVNGWLVEMGVGEMPAGLLYDPELRDLSVEEVYDRITADLRRTRRLATLRGKGRGDILGEPLPHPGSAPYTDLDEFYRRGLVQGFDLHTYGERGLLPAGLIQEIRALAHPPVPWDARLARWFDEYVPRPEPVRSFARPARRQASTPDIPRAGRYFPPEEIARCTFGVVLDTSGSMNAALLGKALGAIASYAQARDVPAARVVFCDAAPYDAGYLPPTEIAGRVRVRGRGGTELQPGIDLLQRAEDFPPGAPVLVITDGWCDILRIRREHAYLIPQGASLPFTPKGPVFRLT
ncbi:AAA family ATPase [Streptomyces sp. NPDC020817]|uniref:DUF2201 family putative metallopeptidase n=1 Tax=Streptomyces sp. NPDC020817 TaxID=3365095 RepID=UPI00379A4BEC